MENNQQRTRTKVQPKIKTNHQRPHHKPQPMTAIKKENDSKSPI